MSEHPSRNYVDRIASGRASTLAELLMLRHHHFVRCAYKTILSREPDAEGLNTYTGRILQGESKKDILAELYRSEEARALSVNIPWLSRKLRRHELIRTLLDLFPARLVGRLKSRAGRISGIEERLEYVEERLRVYEVATRSLADRGDSPISRAQNAGASLPEPPAFGTLDSGCNDGSAANVTAGSSIVFQSLFGQPPQAKRVWRDLTAAIAERRAR